MTLPDELVKAVAEGIERGLRPVEVETRRDGTFTYYDADSEELARVAVAAVLRALPESEALVEELADVEHERWAKWMRWLYRNGKWNDDGSFTIEPDRAQRWRFLSQMTYADLSNETAPDAAWVEARTILAAIAKLADEEES